MKRVTLGEPKNYSALSALHRLAQNPGETVPRGFVALASIHTNLDRHFPTPVIDIAVWSR